LAEKQSTLGRTFSLGNITIYLPEAFQGHVSCEGLHLARKQLHAAWLSTGEEDPPMNPRIVGAPGVGKTTLALHVAQSLNENEVYVMQATSDLRPDDLVIVPVLKSGREIEYRASPLLAAVVNGGVCILDEGNRMSEKCWATLAPLLDQRRYLDSVIAGVRVHAHPKFRFATTMNDDASAYDLPEYILSRLSPKIALSPLNETELLNTFKSILPRAEVQWLSEVVRLMRGLDSHGINCSVRDGVLIARYAFKRMQKPEQEHEKETTLVSALLAEATELTLGDEAKALATLILQGSEKKQKLEAVKRDMKD
jgi:MoxR-like ATPase